MQTIIRVLTIPIFFLLIGCEQGDEMLENKIINSKTYNSKKINFAKVDTSHVFNKYGYYQFIPKTDSTSIIKWGNESILNFSEPFPNYLIDDRASLSWETKKYLAIRRGSGSDTWFEIILPLFKNQKTQYYNNPLAHDSDNDIIICEHIFDNSDTVLIATNMKTGETQKIGMNWQKCSSAIKHYCIDSISVFNKQIYVKWTFPNNIDEPNKSDIKRVKLNL